MTDRKQQMEELVESLGSLRRNMSSRGIDSMKTPRITYSQWGVVMLIGQRGAISVKEAADTLRIRSSAVTQLVDGLVESGYVERKEHAKDRRAVILTLSKKTKSQVEKMKGHMVKKFLEMFEVLSDKEFDQFCTLHRKIAQRFSSKN